MKPGQPGYEMQKEIIKLKYALAVQLEELMHAHIMEEIKAAAHKGVNARSRK